MHRGLFLLDILILIFESVRDERRPGFRKTLLMLALTCRHFRQPALTILWTDVEGIEPLCQLFPCWLQDSSKDDINNQTLELLQQSSFFNARASLLLAFSPSQTALLLSTDRVDFLCALARLKKNLLLFPHVRELNWILPCQGDFFPVIHMFLGPALLSLKLSSAIFIHHLEFMRSIGKLCPNLQVLTTSDVYSWPVREQTIEIISQGVCGLYKLKELRSHQLNEAAFSHLAALSSLRKLDVAFSSAIRTPLPGHPFPNLRTFVASCGSYGVDALIDNLKMMEITPSEAYFHVPALDVSTTTSKNFFVTIAKQLDNRTLRRLEITARVRKGFRYENLPSTTQFQLGVEAMRALLCFKSLRRISLEGVRLFSDIDDGLEEMGAAWPQLEEFSIDCRYLHRSSTYHVPSFRGLVSLVSHCPKLRKVDMVINIDNMETVDTEARGTCNGIITSLCLVSFHRMPNLEVIARKLFSVVPELEVIREANVSPIPVFISPPWNDICARIQELKKERRDGLRVV
ncbi:hypothetical protein BJ138DRAFT_345711 [Hygrophoropsis aurantiaca]|uniref:Uncharacterized protein n=1 Tax=Hygrophoropsis aurantiaca TaxID=72124 RepID=A0ACB8ANI8_9AGAM|nr:hypothetical protein BJ138DRAFT_345711 [Hygrophoropsis aurantiaca]